MYVFVRASVAAVEVAVAVVGRTRGWGSGCLRVVDICGLLRFVSARLHGGECGSAPRGVSGGVCVCAVRDSGGCCVRG